MGNLFSKIEVFSSSWFQRIMLFSVQQPHNNLPQREAHNISELKRFLYFLISGVSDMDSCVWAGVTFTLICDPRLEDWLDWDPTVDPLLAPNPNAENDLWWRIDGVLLTAWRYWKERRNIIRHNTPPRQTFHLNQIMTLTVIKYLSQ